MFQEDWGEQLVGKSCPVICVLDAESGIVSVLDNLPENVSAGQASSLRLALLWKSKRMQEHKVT